MTKVSRGCYWRCYHLSALIASRAQGNEGETDMSASEVGISLPRG